MTNFTGYQWLLIDAANQYGKDKDLFEERIQWTETMLAQGPGYLEAKAPMAETKPLFIKAVMAIRKAQARIPSGHLVGVDAVCSGIQLMSVLTGCVAGARATGLIDENVRSDAYKQTTNVMASILGNAVNISRADAKLALMTSYYGSKAEPKRIFGEDTPELNAFYAAANEVAPGAWELLQDLLASWQPYALSHDWKLPDGYDARVKVMNKKEARVEVDELDHATFTYEFYENQGQKSGLSNVANVTHSVDAYVLRSMHRRCNYDLDQVSYVDQCIQMELLTRSLNGQPTQDAIDEFMTHKVQYYIDQYVRSSLADVTIVQHLCQASVTCLSDAHLKALAGIITGMLKHKPFELVTVHDEFKAHPNNIDQVRFHYKEILADIADSNLLDDLLSQINGFPGNFHKLSFNLGDQIRKSNYGLC